MTLCLKSQEELPNYRLCPVSCDLRILDEIGFTQLQSDL